MTTTTTTHRAPANATPMGIAGLGCAVRFVGDAEHYWLATDAREPRASIAVGEPDLIRIRARRHESFRDVENRARRIVPAGWTVGKAAEWSDGECYVWAAAVAALLDEPRNPDTCPDETGRHRPHDPVASGGRTSCRRCAAYLDGDTAPPVEIQRRRAEAQS